MTAECALVARELHEPLRGTAPEAVGWLCIEQPGPWGRDALTGSRLPDDVAGALHARSTDLADVRVQMIRRSEGGDDDGPRTVFLVHAGTERRWVRRLRIEHPRQLLELDLASLLRPTPPSIGEAHEAPVVLVCTHAKRDACCALWGRPVATELAAVHGDIVWESSHVGGHRFAGNVVILPEGLTYGFLQPEDALRVVDRHTSGLIDLDALRGRAGRHRAAQAAEWFVRERSAARGIDDVHLGAGRPDDDATLVFDAAVGGTRYRIVVRHDELGTPRLTGCDKDTPADPGTWSLVSCDVID